MGAGQPRASAAGGAQAPKGAPGSIHPVGAVHAAAAATAVRPAVPLTTPQTHPQLQAASPQLNNCLRYSAQQPASQTRSAMQMGTYVFLQEPPQAAHPLSFLSPVPAQLRME